eukprot:5289571-Amphidinium_carterae.3
MSSLAPQLSRPPVVDAAEAATGVVALVENEWNCGLPRQDFSGTLSPTNMPLAQLPALALLGRDGLKHRNHYGGPCLDCQWGALGSLVHLDSTTLPDYPDFLSPSLQCSSAFSE